ncbi:MAG: LLM class flavin-dependent oxidoreductase [Deltaproteobacteria bacterium]|nr:LLM class flavin-dependent oxidoreductase [Deltaproteobacteria bacterium]
MEIGMNLPVMAPGLDRDTFLKWCERIDADFFASIAAGERISFYNPDMTATLAAAATLTERVKIIGGVFVPMLHHPVMLAKQLATIDVLSGGRLVAGLGVGGRDQDYQSVDAPLGHRLTRLAESVETMRSVWRAPALSWSSPLRWPRSGPMACVASASDPLRPRWNCNSKRHDAHGRNVADRRHGSERAFGTHWAPTPANNSTPTSIVT